ncbi:MAG TPA: lysozyme inhibitor LprI family protein [Pseudomonas sp.]|nr:lysozyme inhibitor LprI family protein [Pseudomonas sp.]
MRKVITGLALLLLAGPALAASFNCAKAQQPIERSICAYQELDRLDGLLGRRFSEQQQALDETQRKAALNEQRSWLATRTELCTVDDKDCLIELYRKRIQALSNNRQPALVPFKVAVPQTVLRQASSVCELAGLELPADTLVYAAGNYGGRELDVQIDQSGHQATQFDVLVNSPKRPVVLLLGAYEPSIWNIGWTEGSEILAVLAVGYHRQVVAGLPAETPLRTSSYEDKGPCGYLYVSDEHRSQLNPLAQRVFKRNVDLVYQITNGAMVLGEPLPAGATQLTSSDSPPESFVDSSLPKAGPAGLAEAVEKGLMRPAESTDIAAWQAVEESKANKLSQGLPPLANPAERRQFSVHNGYVLLKAQRLPAGLYGAHSATFFLPKGVPYPEGELGHSALYDFNTETCRGAICGH